MYPRNGRQHLRPGRQPRLPGCTTKRGRDHRLDKKIRPVQAPAFQWPHFQSAAANTLYFLRSEKCVPLLVRR